MKKFLFEPLRTVRRSLILDTDIGPDCDDVGALAVMYYLAKRHNTKVLGVMSCSSSEYAPGCIDAINSYCGFPDIPIGTYKKPGLFEDYTKYNKFIAENFSEAYKNGTLQVEDAVQLYRRLLANSPNNSVIIVTIGTLNNIAELMDSPPDAISPFSGIELVQNKVYSMVSMAGKYPNGPEFNIVQHPESAKRVFENFPVPVVYSDFDLGYTVKTGFKNIDEDKYKDNPIYLSYKLYTDETLENSSYDLTAVHFAFEGEGDYYNLSGPVRLTVDLEASGSNTFEEDGIEDSNQYLMRKKRTDIELSHYLNNILLSF